MNAQLNKIIEQLVADSSVMELVKIMQPLEIVAILAKDLDLCPTDASKVTLNLIKHAHDIPFKTSGIESESVPKHDFSRWQFPPDPRAEPNEWPFDAMTKTMMDPKNKGRKRPLMMGSNPLELDLDQNAPGGYGKGVHSKAAPHSRDNAGFTTAGYAGWSKSLSDKEFNLPNENSRRIK